MKRAIVYGLTLALLLGSQGRGHQVSTRLRDSSPVASHHANRGPCFEERFVNIKPGMGHEKVTRRVTALIACAVDRWPVPGGLAEALNVADCESSFWPWSNNGHGDFGVYQISSWPARAKTYLKHRWFPRHPFPPRWSKARANVFVGIRWAHLANSWSAWSCR